MAEKILNTRIRLKYDTLANWQSSVFNGDDASKWLKAGEVAVVTLAPNKEENPEAVAGQHPLLFKVGTGSHKFESLPWVSALAADVYDWAKLTYSDFLKEIEKTFYTEAEIDALLAGYYTKEEVEGLIEAAEGRAATDAINKADKALSDAKAYADTEIQKAVTGGTAGLATEKYVDDKVAGEKSRAEQAESGLSNRIKDLEDNKAGYATATEVATAKSEAIAEAARLDSVLKGELQAEIDSDIATARTAITTEIGQAVAPLATTEALNIVDAKFADYTKTADLPTDLGNFTNNAGYAKTADVITNAEFIAFEGTNAQAIEDAAKAGTDAAAAVLGTASDAATANTVYGAKAAAAAAQKTADDVTARVEAFLDSEEIDDTVNTLKEIQEELKELGDAVKLEEQFAAKVDKTVYNADKEDQAQKDAAQDKALTDAIAAEVQRADGKYATEADLTLAEGRIEELEKKPGLDKVGTVTSVTAGTGLTGGIITESGTIALSDATIASLAKADTALQEHQDISGKADKVTDATGGNFAGLDDDGNLIDSGFNNYDFVKVGDDITIGDSHTTNISENGLHLSNEDAGNTASFGLSGISISESENAEDKEYFKVGFKSSGDTATGKCDGVEVQGSVGFKTAFNEFLGTDRLNDIIDEDGMSHVDSATEADRLDGHDADYFATADGLASANEEIDKKANDADLAAIAKTGNVNDLVQTEGDILVFNCGSASTVI